MTTLATVLSVPLPIAIRRFALHFVEMCVIMCAGGLVLDFAVFGTAVWLGYPNLVTQAPELSIPIIAFDFALAMALYMALRGHPVRHSRRKHYQFTAIDDCTRLRVLRIYDQLGQKTAIQLVDYVLRSCPSRPAHPEPQRLGAPGSFIGTCWTAAASTSYIRPATPRLNGKVERSHRIDPQEF